MALMMVLLSIVVLTVFLTEVQQQASTSFAAAISARDRLKGEYAAMWEVQAKTNDFLVAARAGTGVSVKTFATTESAVAAASDGDGLLVMAEAMLPSNPQHPQNGTGVSITPAQWAAIKAKKLIVLDADCICGF